MGQLMRTLLPLFVHRFALTRPPGTSEPKTLFLRPILLEQCHAPVSLSQERRRAGLLGTTCGGRATRRIGSGEHPSSAWRTRAEWLPN